MQLLLKRSLSRCAKQLGFHGAHPNLLSNEAQLFFNSEISCVKPFLVLAYTPGPHLMRIHLVRYSTSARYEKYSIIHLVRPIIHLVRIFALSTS